MRVPFFHSGLQFVNHSERKSNKRFVRSYIRKRWKGASEFIFWGAFSYDKKGPCHCWAPETAAEKKASIKAIEKINKELEPLLKE